VKKGEGACLNLACPDHDPRLAKVRPATPAKGTQAQKAQRAPKPPGDWAELRPFLPELPREEREAVEALARGEGLGEAEARLAKRALFKLRMRKGRARKEAVKA